MATVKRTDEQRLKELQAKIDARKKKEQLKADIAKNRAELAKLRQKR